MRRAILILLLLIVASCSSSNHEPRQVHCLEEELFGHKYTVQCYVIFEDDNHRVAVNGIVNTRTTKDVDVDVFMYVDNADVQRYVYPKESASMVEYLGLLVYNDYINEVQMDSIKDMMKRLETNKLLFNERVKRD